MKYTHLDMVQTILSAMNSDEVNSWSDTAESRQVAEVLRNTYFEIISRANLPEHNKFFALEDSLNPTMPTVMYVPDNVARIEWIDYNNEDVAPNDEHNYIRLNFYDVDSFFRLSDRLNTDDNTVGSFEINDKLYKYSNNRYPSRYTIVEDRVVIFDSYDSDVDTTLQASKMRCYGRVIPVYTMSNTFVPDLDDDQFSLLINEAKDTAFQEIKQTVNPKAQQEARRGWRNLARVKAVKEPNPLDIFADFGRRRP